MTIAINWPLVQLPSWPAPRTIEYRMQNIVGFTKSPFTAQRQGYNWGQGWWEWSVAYPPMMENLAENWIAFLMSCIGTTNVFQLGDPLKTSPRGSGSGAPYVNGLCPSGTYVLTTSGWTPNAMGVLLPGDYLQIGYRLYRYSGVVPLNADSSGNATIPIWPPIREVPNGGQTSPPDFDSIVLNNCTGLWRLKSNSQQFMLDYDQWYKQLTFEVEEAL